MRGCAVIGCARGCLTDTRSCSLSARSGKSCASSCLTKLSCATKRSRLFTACMIELVHIVKKFGELTAVNDLSLTVERGELFAVLGPNAAGKTTTIKVLTGLIKPTSGTARVAGFDVQEQPLLARRRMAYVPDFPFL